MIYEMVLDLLGVKFTNLLPVDSGAVMAGRQASQADSRLLWGAESHQVARLILRCYCIDFQLYAILAVGLADAHTQLVAWGGKPVGERDRYPG